MNVTAINGSPRKEGNTWHALMGVGKQLQENGNKYFDDWQDQSKKHIGNQQGAHRVRLLPEECVFTGNLFYHLVFILKSSV